MQSNLDTLVSKLARGALAPDVSGFAALIKEGRDPLGDFFCNSVSASARREEGATFTPDWLVQDMLDRIALKAVPQRVIDVGAGTGRYALAAARRWPKAVVVAVEKNPVLAESIKANARISRLRIKVICEDFIDLQLPKIDGVTAFIGNPPYVRHHDIPAHTKQWYADEMKRQGLNNSLLAGLHIYFFLKSFLLSAKGDIGCFVTAAEWTETGYGEGMRHLFCRMGGDEIIRVNPTQKVFADALTTSIISGWSVGNSDSVTVKDLRDGIATTRFIAPHEELQSHRKWPGYGLQLPEITAAGSILGDYFQVNRGQVTGMNAVWIATEKTAPLIPSRYLFPCVTGAREVITANGLLSDNRILQRVIDLPLNLNELSTPERRKVDRFLEIAAAAGARDTYVARHRQAWWKVGLKSPPSVIMTYMGRRPPCFARNACGARIINVAHGLTPKRTLSAPIVDRIVQWLNQNVKISHGRTYGGGLVKFEPAEAMSIAMPASPAIVAVA